MTEDFVTQLRLQLREAALREERRTPFALRVGRARRGLPGPVPVAAALATVLLALAVALGTLALRGAPEPAAPKLIGLYPVAAGLSPLAPGFGSVWTADPIRGQVLRIDPATRRVVKRIPVHAEAVVGTGAGAVWALAGDLQYSGDRGPVRLLRIDPATNRVVERIPMRTPAGKSFAPFELQIDQGVVWVVGATGALRVDPRRNVADRFVRLGESTRGAVTDGDGVWVLALDGRLRRIDAPSGRAVDEARVRTTADTHLFGGGPRGTLAVVSGDRIALLDRPSGRTLWAQTLDGEIRYLIGDDEVLWAVVSRAPAETDRLVRLDADSGRRRGQVALPEPGVTGMAKVGRDLWVATPGGKIVVAR
jgi:sugar lactone lactonase YvrE